MNIEHADIIHFANYYDRLNSSSSGEHTWYVIVDVNQLYVHNSWQKMKVELIRNAFRYNLFKGFPIPVYSDKKNTHVYHN